MGVGIHGARRAARAAVFCSLSLAALQGCSEPVDLGDLQVDCLCSCETCLIHQPVCDIGPNGELICVDECVLTTTEPVPGVACADSPSEGQIACQNACNNGGCGFLTSSLSGAACTLHSPARVMAGLVPGSTEVNIDPNLSVAVLTIEGTPAQVRPSGTVRFTGGDCAGQSCPIEINWMKLDFPDFSIDGHPVEQGSVLSDGRWQGTKASDNGFVLDRSTILATANGRIDDDPSSNEFFPNDSLSGSYNVATGAFTLVGTNLVATTGDGTVSFVLQGTTSARPPIANAGPDQTVTCSEGAGGALVTLDGSGSSDADGNLETITWSTGSNVLGQGITLAVELPVGAHTVVAEAIDATSKTDRDETVITVVDDTGPEIVPASATLTVAVCTPVPQPVMLALPTVRDACSPTGVTVSGEVIAIHGTSVTPRPVAANGEVVLPVGSATVRWTAIDSRGNSSVLDQTVEVQDAPTPSCCAPAQTLVQGTANPDLIVRIGGSKFCVLAAGAADVVRTGAGGDYVSGGSGNDVLDSSGGNDVLVGNAGADLITLGLGTARAFGGAGDDVLQALTAASAELNGGTGNDALQGGPGADLIVPGGGRDVVLAGAGDDTVRIYDVCELVAGEVLSGGFGDDTLITSVGLPQLNALGVAAIGFEHIVVDATQSALADCP